MRAALALGVQSTGARVVRDERGQRAGEREERRDARADARRVATIVREIEDEREREELEGEEEGRAAGAFSLSGEACRRGDFPLPLPTPHRLLRLPPGHPLFTLVFRPHTVIVIGGPKGAPGVPTRHHAHFPPAERVDARRAVS